MVLSSKEPSLSLTGTILALVSASAIFLREKTLQSWVLRLVCVSLRCLSRMSMPYDSTNHKGFLVEIWSYFWYASIHPTAKAVGTLEERHRGWSRSMRLAAPPLGHSFILPANSLGRFGCRFLTSSMYLAR